MSDVLMNGIGQWTAIGRGWQLPFRFVDIPNDRVNLSTFQQLTELHERCRNELDVIALKLQLCQSLKVSGIAVYRHTYHALRTLLQSISDKHAMLADVRLWR